MIERPNVRLALSASKTPLRAGQLPGPSATAPATQAELEAAPRNGVVPRSLGLVCIDIDAGTLPLAERVAAVKRIFGEPAGRQDTPRQGGGVHLFYPADCAFTLGSFDLNGAVSGDVKHDRQYVVIYDEDAIARARKAAMDSKRYRSPILPTNLISRLTLGLGKEPWRRHRDEGFGFAAWPRVRRSLGRSASA